MRHKGPASQTTRPAAAAPGPGRPAGPARDRQVNFVPWLVAAGLVVAVLIDYGHLFGSDSEWFRADDDEYVVQNKHVNTGLTNDNIRWGLFEFHSANWHPLTWWSLQLDSEIWGNVEKDGKRTLDPGGFHLTNALLHAAAGVLLMWTLTRMTGNFWRSALVAALFTLHPLRVESVAWAAERKDVLGSLLWVLTMLAYDWYVRQPSIWRYSLVFVSFALGLMAKPLLVTLPCALLLLDYWPLRRLDKSGAWKWLVVEKLPLFALSAGACVLTVMAQGVADPEGLPVYEALPLPLRVLNAGRAYVVYVRKTFWPFDLAPMYTEPHALFPKEWAAAACGIVLVVTAVVLLYLRRRPYLAVGWLWYLGTLVPMAGFVAIGIHTLCDRYTYVPHIGLFIMLVWGLGDLLAGRVPPKALAAVAGVLVFACFVQGYRQAELWCDNITILTHATEVSANNFGAHDFLGVALMEKSGTLLEKNHSDEARKLTDEARKLTDEALTHFRESIRIEPNYAVSHYNLGKALAQRQQWAAAAESFTDTLRLVPKWILPKVDLGLTDMQLGKMEEAVELLGPAVAFAPQRAELRYNYGMALLYRGRYAEAEREAREALRLIANFYAANKLLGFALAVQGKPAEALHEFEAPPREPTCGHYIAWCLNAMGKVEESRTIYRNLAAGVPEWPKPVREEAWRLATTRDATQRNGHLALLRAEVAVQVSEAAGKPDAKALDALAAAQAELGRYKDAAATQRRALAAGGDSAMEARLKLYEDGKPYRE
jgi:tetratricopeptide (TPR) repeat protein